MTEPGDGNQTGQVRRWDVALSFAGAQRDYVSRVAAALKARDVRCFYDADQQVRLWGTHLAEELPRIYSRESAVVVVFVSADYVEGGWTRLERRAAFSQAVAQAGVHVLPARFDDSELPGLLPDVVSVDLRRYTPEQFADLLVAKLACLGVRPWAPEQPLPSAGAVRVAEADLRRLGVHAAITVPEAADDDPPVYVGRDADEGPLGVRARMAAAALRGGFVLLVGGSSVGKTRCAAEAVKAVLADWWLVHPDGPQQVATLAAAQVPQVVVWLDELQHYLDGDYALTGGVIRALLAGPHPAVIIATMWPDRYTTYTTPPQPDGADPHWREREVLELATVIRISPQLSPAEHTRAQAAAAGDLRLRAALAAPEYGLTQTLAAAPQLVARWQDAQTAHPYAWAILTAALDTARLGAQAPLTAGLLRAAAPGYCTSQQQAAAPANWFEQALAYATTTLHGATAALAPAGTGVMGQTAGYTPADYLIQHATRERRSARLPASTWEAIVQHIHNPNDAQRLADSARNRLRYTYAIPLYRNAADAGYEHAADRLAELLVERGDAEEAFPILRAQADAHGRKTVWILSSLLMLVEHGDLDELRAWADIGNWNAAERLAGLLEQRGDLEELRARADAGDGSAAQRLAGLLEQRGDLDEAAQVLRARADAGDSTAAERLAELLVRHGDLDEAVRVLRARADAGDWVVAAWRLADLLAERGDLEELRARADAGELAAVVRLADLLAERGDLEELRARADIGYWNAAERLAGLLEQRGDLEELRARADAGDGHAAGRLARLLEQRGDLEELRARADAGDGSAAQRLAGLLEQRGDLDEAAQVLRARADAGDNAASERLAGLLVERGDLEELRARADAGDGSAAQRLAGLLAKQGREQEAAQLRRFGLTADGSIASA